MDKYVLITGAAKRIGKALALGFAKKGFSILLHYNTSEKEANELSDRLKRMNVNVVLLKADLRNPEEISDMFAQIKSQNLVPEVLINNAAIFPAPKSFREITEEDWNNTLESNLNSVFNVSKRYIDTVKEGRIINFASLGAHEVWSGRTPYHAAKSGVLHLTRAMAKDLAPEFSVNSISPGVIDIPEDPNDDKSISFESRIPMGRFGNTEDIFDAVWFFSTASKYITGQDLQVDGGWHYSR